MGKQKRKDSETSALIGRYVIYTILGIIAFAVLLCFSYLTLITFEQRDMLHKVDEALLEQCPQLNIISESGNLSFDPATEWYSKEAYCYISENEVFQCDCQNN